MSPEAVSLLNAPYSFLCLKAPLSFLASLSFLQLFLFGMNTLLAHLSLCDFLFESSFFRPDSSLVFLGRLPGTFPSIGLSKVQPPGPSCHAAHLAPARISRAILMASVISRLLWITFQCDASPSLLCLSFINLEDTGKQSTGKIPGILLPQISKIYHLKILASNTLL